MKVRSGFVSNSSSSSFVVSGTDEMLIMRELVKKLGRFYRNENELMSFYLKEWGSKEEDHIRDRFSDEIEDLRAGKIVFIGEIDNGAIEYFDRLNHPELSVRWEC